MNHISHRFEGNIYCHVLNGVRDNLLGDTVTSLDPAKLFYFTSIRSIYIASARAQHCANEEINNLHLPYEMFDVFNLYVGPLGSCIARAHSSLNTCLSLFHWRLVD